MPPPRPGPRGGPQERRIPVAIPPRARPHSVSHPRGWANAGLQRSPSSVTGVYAPGRPRLAHRRRSRSVDWVSDVDETVFPGAIPGDAPHPSATGTGLWRGSASGDRIVPGNLRPMGTGPRRPPIPAGAGDQPARSDHRVVCVLPTPRTNGGPTPPTGPTGPTAPKLWPPWAAGSYAPRPPHRRRQHPAAGSARGGQDPSWRLPWPRGLSRRARGPASRFVRPRRWRTWGGWPQERPLGRDPRWPPPGRGALPAAGEVARAAMMHR